MVDLPPVEAATVGAIYAAYEARRHDEARNYLGMSTLGTECDRQLWYGWRQASQPETFDGRKIRLFETGHREETRIIDDLRLAGITVHDHDEESEKQFAVSCLGGHCRGHLDGAATGVPEAPKVWHLVEIKTHNEKSFKALLKDGVEKSKPGHFAQMQMYMHHAGLTRALYVAQNKNDEGLYAERVPYDAVKALQLVARVERVLRAPEPPFRLHDDPTAKAAFACAWCPALGICHGGEFARSHCRTCVNATPIIDDDLDGVWRCERHDRDLSTEEQKKGCPQHLFIPSLVPGEQIDADLAHETITYRLADGSVWIDGHRGDAP